MSDKTRNLLNRIGKLTGDDKVGIGPTCGPQCGCSTDPKVFFVGSGATITLTKDGKPVLKDGNREIEL